MQNQKRILICPLDWGLGHATRCIPIIRLLMKYNAEIIIASDGRPMELLKKEFPHAKFIRMPGYPIQYPDNGSMAFKMLWSLPRILKGIKQEHELLEGIVKEHRIDIVISDNRYGCWSTNARSIFITHQLMIKAPFGEGILHKKVLSMIRNFNECWIPDESGDNNLSGDLSHEYPLPENTFFIGPISRFDSPSVAGEMIKYDLMGIVSGPEPQRTRLKEILSIQLKAMNKKALLVCGETESQWENKPTENLTLVSHLDAEKMKDAILGSDIIIARSGYSSIMDLSALGKKVIFIPTPGQTEQEYLAERFMSKGIAFAQEQSKFDLRKALEESIKLSGFEKKPSRDLLEKKNRIVAR